MRRFILFVLSFFLAVPAAAEPILLRPAQVFDGVNPAPHQGWQVVVDGDRINFNSSLDAYINGLTATAVICSSRGN